MAESEPGPTEEGAVLRDSGGDLGIKGALLTDERARVLTENGTLIRGLYAAGNTSASVMGRTYPGVGSILGPALTFAFIAVNQMAQEWLILSLLVNDSAWPMCTLSYGAMCTASAPSFVYSRVFFSGTHGL